MALGHSPKVVTDGLVFYYDMGNPQKSWRGAPTINLIPNPAFLTGSISPWSYQTIENGNQVLDSTVKFNNQYSSVRITRTSLGGEANCWLNLSASQGLLPNTQYTFSAYCLANNPNQAAIFSFFSTSSNGFAYHSGNGMWEKLSHTFTTRSTEPYIQIRMWHNTTLLNSPVWFIPLQVEQNSFATPFVVGTRSNTQSILDLSNNNTVTASSLTYNSDGTFSFNGSTNYLSLNSILSVKPFTISFWTKLNSIKNQGFYSSRTVVGSGISIFGLISGSIRFDTGDNQWTPTYTLETNKWINIVFSIDDAKKYLYVNGVFHSSTSYSSTISNISSSIATVGASQIDGSSYDNYVDGSLSNYVIHNRAITADEISQNFNALRGRYGI